MGTDLVDTYTHPRCFAFGCLAGAIREASDIYISASLHGGLMTSYAFLSIYTNEFILNISLFISWSIFFRLLDIFFRESENLKLRDIESKATK